MSEKPSPFSYVLSDDKTKLKLVPHEGEFVYSADEVTRLLEYLVTMRSQMIPAISDSPAGTRLIDSDRFEVIQNRMDGTAQVYSRISGVMWTCLSLTKEQCAAMAETLVPPNSPPDAQKH
jgi:hypothetical protein